MRPSPASGPGLAPPVAVGRATVARVGVALVLAGLVAAVLTASAPSSPLFAVHLRSGVLPEVGTTAASGAGLVALLVLGGYGLTLATARSLSLRAAWTAVVLAHVLLLLGPILFSQDVFNYIAYARLGVLHHLDPYTHGAIAAPQDPVYAVVGWHHVASAYGPLFTLLSYPTALLSVVAATWAMKVAAVAAALATVALTARCAARLGRPVPVAVVLVGLNPIWLLWAVGGAHNDLLMLAALMAGVAAALIGRHRWAGAAVIGAAAIKLTGLVALPFLLVRRGGRVAVLTGAAVAAGLVAAASIPAFGSHALGFFAVLRHQQHDTSLDSLPVAVGRLTADGLWSAGWLGLVHGALLAGLAYAAARAHRADDWLSGLAWGLLLTSAITPWYLPWYTIWPLPAAAICRDRRVLVAVLVLQGLVFFHRNWVLLS